MTINRSNIDLNLPTRAPSGLDEDCHYASESDLDAVYAQGGISLRTIEEARWLGLRTDGHIATAPYAARIAEITEILYPGWLEDQEDGSMANFFAALPFDGSLHRTVANAVEVGSLPYSIEPDQVEDWLTYQALKSLARFSRRFT